MNELQMHASALVATMGDRYVAIAMIRGMAVVRLSKSEPHHERTPSISMPSWGYTVRRSKWVDSYGRERLIDLMFDFHVVSVLPIESDGTVRSSSRSGQFDGRARP